MRQFAVIVVLALSALLIAQNAKKTPPSAAAAADKSAAKIPDGPTKVSGDGVKTSSGLQYWDVKKGTGATAVNGKHVSVQYTGWLESGKEFDSSLDVGDPIEFDLGKGMVIKGWDEGIAGMKVGGKRQLHIPPALGYGARGAGSAIPPNATLIFDVELVKVK